MIAVDTNILVYAHRADATLHAAAKDALTRLAEDSAPWAIPWTCLHEFLAVVTHPRIYQPPTPLSRALAQVDAWLESPSLVLLAEAHSRAGAGSEEATYWRALRDLLATGKIAGPRVHDARIAALCRSHGVRELWSADRDFSRFPTLRVRNPLV